MTTQQIIIFNDSVSSAGINLSAEFTSGMGFYLIAPGSSYEYEINIFLQLSISNTEKRLIRLEPHNISNTERLTLLPTQIVDLGLPMQLLIVPSTDFAMQIILVQSDCSLCQIQSDISTLKNQINSNFAAVNQTLAAMQTTLGQILAIVTTDVVVTISNVTLLPNSSLKYSACPFSCLIS